MLDNKDDDYDVLNENSEHSDSDSMYSFSTLENRYFLLRIKNIFF